MIWKLWLHILFFHNHDSSSLFSARSHYLEMFNFNTYKFPLILRVLVWNFPFLKWMVTNRSYKVVFTLDNQAFQARDDSLQIKDAKNMWKDHAFTICTIDMYITFAFILDWRSITKTRNSLLIFINILKEGCLFSHVTTCIGSRYQKSSFGRAPFTP